MHSQNRDPCKAAVEGLKPPQTSDENKTCFQEDLFFGSPLEWDVVLTRIYMSSSLNSLKGDYIGDYIGDYYRGY